MSDKKTGNKTSYLPKGNIDNKTFTGKTFLFYGLVGSSMLFLALTLMYIIWITRHEISDSYRLPKVFTLSSVVMLLSSYSLTFSSKAFKEDNSSQLLISLASTFALSITFCGLQIAGWLEMFSSGIKLSTQNGTSFLYIISGVHFLHVVGGVLYLFYLNLKAFDNWNDPVKSLIYFSNKYEGYRIQLFNSYWHFIDLLWIILFFTFLFTF